MTNRFTILAAAAAFFIGFSSPASAEFASIESVGPWAMRASDKTCVAQASYKNGTALDFWLDDTGKLAIAITNSEWSIPEGEYDVVVHVDRSSRETIKGHAQRTFVMWLVETNEATINLLSYGRTMFVTVGRVSYQYDLVRSEAMLKALGQCVATRLASANPFGGAAPQASAPANPFAETTSNPYRRM